MTPSGERLDKFLTKAAQEFKPAERVMPEVGGKALADSFKVGLAGLKKELDALRLDASGALTELSSEVKNGNEAVKRIRAETAAVKSAFAEILGNEAAEQSQEPKTGVSNG